MAGKREWTFVESSEFQKNKKSYLSSVEFDALKELIPRHPNKWIELDDGPGLFALHWGVKSPVTIVFMVSPETRKVYLLGIEPGKQHTVLPAVKKALPHLLRGAEEDRCPRGSLARY